MPSLEVTRLFQNPRDNLETSCPIGVVGNGLPHRGLGGVAALNLRRNKDGGCTFYSHNCKRALLSV